jgi:predicted secreted protein
MEGRQPNRLPFVVFLPDRRAAESGRKEPAVCRYRTLLAVAALYAPIAVASAAEYRQTTRPGNSATKTAAQPKAKPNVPADRIIVAATDNGKTVTAEVGKTVELRLTGDRGAGYEWRITGVAGDSMQAVGKPQFTPAPNIPGKPGGVFSFPYKAVKPGRTTIKAAFVHAGDKNAKPLHTYRVEIAVKKP